MREFEERRRLKKFLHSRYAIAILIIVCGLLLHAVWGVYGKYQKSKEIADRAKTELNELSERELALTNSIEDLKTEPGIEREVRERFGVVKEGEILVVLVDDENDKEEISPIVKENWWQKFINLFTRN